jgi:hypothetical protein
MLVDDLSILEGSSISNLVMPNVTEAQRLALPFPNVGEVVYQTSNPVGLYVYDGTSWLKTATSTSSGTLELPVFAGDVTSTLGSNFLTLKTVVTPGTYSRVTVDEKGRVTAGFSPTTASGQGITDVYTKTEIDSSSRVSSINGKTGIITKLAPTDITGLALSATTDTTNAANITTGKLPLSVIPVFTGDITNSTSSTDILLKDVSVAGTYNKITINSKGLVTSGSLENTLAGMGVVDGISASLLPSGNATSAQIVMGNDTRLLDSRTPKTHTHISTDISDFISKTTDLVASTTQLTTNRLLDGVPTTGNTLNKLYDLIVAGNTQLVVNTIGDRDSLNITTTSVTVFVEDDGTGNWAIYKPTSIGQPATFFQILSKIDLAVATGTEVEVLANKDPDGSLLSNSDYKYPSQRAVKTYVDSRILAAGPQGAGVVASTVLTVNGFTPDLTGNVATPYIATINGTAPDSAHNISLTNILSVNNVRPNSTTGNIALDVVTTINGKSGSIEKILPTDIAGVFDSVSGNILSSMMPVFTGDITSPGGTTSLNLSTITGLTAGTYNSVTVDTKGRVTAGTSVQYTTTDASLLSSGTVNSARLPTFVGDVTLTPTTNELYLTPINGLTAGTYNNVTVDNKGRVVAGNTHDLLPVRVIRRNLAPATYNLPVSALAGYDSLPLTIRKANGSVVSYTMPSNAL